MLDAARLVFAVQGPGAPVSEVAARADVGMGSLYRRFPSKEAMLEQLSLVSLRDQADAAERAAEGREPGRALAAYLEAAVELRVGALAQFAGQFPLTQELLDAARRAHALVDDLVRRAQEADAVRPDITTVDVQRLIELFSRRPEHDVGWRRLLALAIDGLGAQSGRDPLPGSPPTWGDDAARWWPQVGGAQFGARR